MWWEREEKKGAEASLLPVFAGGRSNMKINYFMLPNSSPETTVDRVYTGHQFQETKDGKEARSLTRVCDVYSVGEQLLGVSQRNS